MHAALDFSIEVAASEELKAAKVVKQKDGESGEVHVKKLPKHSARLELRYFLTF